MSHEQVFSSRWLKGALAAIACITTLAMLAECVLFAGPAPPAGASGASPTLPEQPDRNRANGSGAFATGQYRNLFAEAGHSPEEITNNKHHDVRTEGLSYGMMIAVQLDKKAEFDAIWNWSKTYLYHGSPRHPSCGFFSWQAKTNGECRSEFVAPDGEEYYVMALYFAAHRWGSGAGIYNYQAEADRLLADMRH